MSVSRRKFLGGLAVSAATPAVPMESQPAVATGVCVKPGKETREFDVVVVGGGSAGCVVANRLCQGSNLSVCLVEGGPDYGPAHGGRWPEELLDGRYPPPTHDWGYFEDLAERRIGAEPRGKVIGGSSAINMAAAMWGLPEDYDRWARAGNPGWTYAELRPLIDRIEKTADNSQAKYRGSRGLLPTEPYGDSALGLWARSFLESAGAAGFERLADLSAPEPAEGAAALHANIRNGIRWNAAFAFLDPVRGQRNLTILDEFSVDRLLVRQDKAVALLGRRGQKIVELRASRFVLCAGTYGSPAILMRSGIGPPSHLGGSGIVVGIDLPGVGQNLQDHPGVGVTFAGTSAVRQALEDERARCRFYAAQAMLRAQSPHAQGGFDLQLPAVQRLDNNGEWVSSIVVFNVAPRSRGQVQLLGPDPRLPLRIEKRFLTNPEQRDIAVLAHGVRVARKVGRQKPLADLVTREVAPGEAVREESDIRAYVRRMVRNYNHACGTCKMGPRSDPGSVVDRSGRLHGAANVWVADASIIPQIPRVPTNLTCMLIGLRIADGLLSARPATPGAL